MQAGTRIHSERCQNEWARVAFQSYTIFFFSIQLLNGAQDKEVGSASTNDNKKLTIDGGFHISMTDMLAARINHCGDNMGENCEEPLIMPGGFFSTA